MPSNDALINVDRVSKKFCRSLKRSLWYGVQDLAAELTGSLRGNRLALVRHDWTGSDETIGPSEHEVLVLIEVDDAGESVAIVLFDADARDVAWAELEARFEAGEAASARRGSVTRAFTRAFADRDWDGLASLLATDLVVEDHRLLGVVTSSDILRYVSLKSELEG